MTAVDRVKASLDHLTGQGVVDGIRPHLPRTPEEDCAARELAERYARDNPVDAADLLPEG